MTPEERTQFIVDVAAAIKASAPTPALSEEEHQWVRLAIQKEAQSIKLRQAVIEKTLSGLVWAALVGFGYVFLDWAKTHGFKP